MKARDELIQYNSSKVRHISWGLGMILSRLHPLHSGLSRAAWLLCFSGTMCSPCGVVFPGLENTKAWRFEFDLCMRHHTNGIKWWMKVIMSHNARIVHYEGKLFIESSIVFMTLSCRVHQGCVMYCAQRIIHFRLGWTYEMPFNLSEETSRIKEPRDTQPTTKLNVRKSC